MSKASEHANTADRSEHHEPRWWDDVFELGTGERGAASAPVPEVDADPPFPEIEFVIDEQTGGGDPDLEGLSRRRRATYTLDAADRLLVVLRALPAKDPAQRRLDKQAVIRHLAGEITALQQRGYTLEEIAGALSAEDVEITCPTLKNYLQRSRRAAAAGGKKRRSRADLPLVLRGRIRG